MIKPTSHTLVVVVLDFISPLYGKMLAVSVGGEETSEMPSDGKEASCIKRQTEERHAARAQFVAGKYFSST